MRLFSKKAFTLAEVLIALGIVGVVAVITLPSLIQKRHEKDVVTKLQKNFNIFSQAYQRIRMEEGYDIIDEEYNSMSSADKALFIAEKFRPYLKILKDCGSNGGCMDTRYTKSLSGVGYNHYYLSGYRLILNDGTLIRFEGFNNGFSIFLYIDGKNGKYIMGKDMFQILGNSKLIYPAGDIMYSSNKNYFKQKCRYIEGDRESGLGCTAWVIYNGNLDYLRCPEKLDWNGETKCN